MTEIIGIRFKESGKVYYFDPAGLRAQRGELIVVETANGTECGECMIANSTMPDNQIKHPLRKALRKADDVDRRKYQEKQKKQEEAMRICAEKIAKHGLDMKLVEAECSFDSSKIVFYFTSDGRVDFRDLVRDLASVFHTRIELRQIGVRDEAKMLGGLGICGREFCCTGFLSDFQPVSIKMAKEQGLSLNPVKISGTCGRLMCCLKYEQDAYDYLSKMTPRVGSVVRTADGDQGVVTELNLISGAVKVRLDSSPETPPATFHRDDLTFLRGRGQKPPVSETEGQEAGEVEAPRQKEGNSQEKRRPDGNDRNRNRPRPAPEKRESRPEGSEAPENGARPENGDAPRRRRNRHHRGHRPQNGQNGQNGGAAQPRTEKPGTPDKV